MFFLLASFMMVSLNMTKIENIRVDVPAATQVRQEFPPDLVHVALDKAGAAWVEKQRVSAAELYTVMTNRFQRDPHVAVYIAGDVDTHHGDMVAVLEAARRAGIQRVSFIATPAQTGNTGKN